MPTISSLAELASSGAQVSQLDAERAERDVARATIAVLALHNTKVEPGRSAAQHVQDWIANFHDDETWEWLCLQEENDSAPEPEPEEGAETFAWDADPEPDPENDNASSKAAKPNRPTVARLVDVFGRYEAWSGVIGYDEFAGRTVARKAPPVRKGDRVPGTCGPWTDAHTTRALTWYTGEEGVQPNSSDVDKAIEMVARTHSFHPVREYLRTLKWDGTPRLDTMLTTYFGSAPSPYASLVGSKFMISAVARAMKPGCKVDTMLILQGEQGTKKSTAIRALAGDAWFADTALDFHSKDAAQNLPGRWIYEIGELQGFNRGDVTRIKAFVTSQKDSFRPSYGRRTEDFPRGTVFVGTTNDEHYLTDTTGNRRYWPVTCGKVDAAALTRDRDQLWAESLARFEAGERWWLEGAEEQLARAEQAEREAEDPWKAELEAFLTVTPLPKHGFAMGHLMGSAGSDSEDASPGIYIPVERRTAATTQRIGRIMKQLGYERSTTRLPDGSTPKHYFPKK